MFSDFRYRLRAVFRRTAMERELSNELQFHRERLVAKLTAAGVSPAEAERRARIEMGGIEQIAEVCRDARGVSPLESTLQDLRYAVRQLRKNAGFTAVVIASLTLGIGANTAIFTLIDALLLRVLPVVEPQQLQLVTVRQPNGTRSFEHAEFRALRTANPVFADIAAYGTTRLNVSIEGLAEPTAEGQLVSGTYFSLLGVGAIVGRTIGPEDDAAPNAHPVAVIGYQYWRRRFGLDPAAVGRTISLSGRPFTIVGVTPPEFFGLEVGRAADVFVPIMMQPTVMPAAENWLQESLSRNWWLTVVGRLPDDRTPQQAVGALAGLDVLTPLMTKPSRPGEAPTRISERLDLMPAATGVSSLRHQFSQPLFVLMGVSGVVLLIACANAASVVLSRGASRQTEFSMRLALGAGRGRLIRQLLVESIVLALAGGMCGLLLARWATEAMVRFLSSGRAPIVLDLSPDLRVLGFTAAVSIVTGVICGVVPALRATRVDVISGLKGRTRTATAGGSWLRPGKVLVVSQVALCLVLLFGAGLFVRSLQSLDGHDRGFDRASVLVMRVEPKGSDQRGRPGASVRLDRIYRDLLERIETLPGVRSASLAHFGPTTQVGYSAPLTLSSGETVGAPRLMAYPNYFATMGMAIRAGRDLHARDLDQGAPPVAVVNEAFVRQILNGSDPVGRTVLERDGQSREIIGVVQDLTYASLRSGPQPLMYQPFLQTNTGRGQMTLHVRLAGPAADVAARIREEVQRIDPDMPLFAVHTLAEQMASALSRERLVATLSGLFGLVALLLACVGLYGLMAFAVVQRTSELGVRMALGAAKWSVVGMVVREALALVLVGLVIGIPATLLVVRLAASQISGLLFGLTATDPRTMIGAALVLIGVAAVAAYFPAARAARIDPISALRAE